MIGQRLVDLYRYGDKRQAIEIARCFGGEVERLVLEMHRAHKVSLEIATLADKISNDHADALENKSLSYHITDQKADALVWFLWDGEQHWTEAFWDAVIGLHELEAA